MTIYEKYGILLDAVHVAYRTAFLENTPSAWIEEIRIRKELEMESLKISLAPWEEQLRWIESLHSTQEKELKKYPLWIMENKKKESVKRQAYFDDLINGWQS